jgi:3-methylcrotonyl-CoA carboxylase alpha subunit
VSIVEGTQRISVFYDGRSYTFDLPDPLTGAEAEQAGGDAIIAPMPGVVKVVSTSAGAPVEMGDALLVLEAMKMEHTLTAPRDGIVAEVLTSVDDQVTDGTLLLALEPEDG